MGYVFIEEHVTVPWVVNIGHEVSTSFSHEDCEDNVICSSVQNSYFDDVMVNLDSAFIKENPLYDDEMLGIFISLFDKNNINKVVEVSKENFQFDIHGFGMDYWKCFGHPIYDTNGDDYREENVDYVPL
jgi:hypothetical protein